MRHGAFRQLGEVRGENVHLVPLREERLREPPGISLRAAAPRPEVVYRQRDLHGDFLPRCYPREPVWRRLQPATVFPLELPRDDVNKTTSQTPERLSLRAQRSNLAVRVDCGIAAQRGAPGCAPSRRAALSRHASLAASAYPLLAMTLSKARRKVK